MLLAQTAHFGGAARLVQSLNLPGNVVVDAAGNVFVAVSPTGVFTPAQITEIAADGTVTPSITPQGETLTQISGLAIDRSGYLYIVDYSGNSTSRVIRMKPDGSDASVILPTGTLIDAGAIAVDGSGNVYIADSNGNAPSRIIELPNTNGAYGGPSALVPATEQIGTSTLQLVDAMSVDPSGNILITDVGSTARLIKVTSAGAATELISYSQSIGMGGTLYHPYGVGTDAQGDIFLADRNSNSQGRVIELPYSSGNYGMPFEYISPRSGILTYPMGLAIDSNGNLYIPDSWNDVLNTDPNGGLIEISTTSANFDSALVATTTPTIRTLTFTFDSPGSLNGTTPYQVLTRGAAMDSQGSPQDFTAVSSGTTCVGSFEAGDSCAANVAFSPKYPGLRMGAVELLNRSGAAIATAYIFGTGTGPQVAFPHGKQSTLGGGFNQPRGVAVDGNGTVYTTDIDSPDKQVMVVKAGCNVSTCVTTLNGGFSIAEGVAVDGAGNLYVTDPFTNSVKEMPAGCTSPSCVTTLGSDFKSPAGVAVNGSGNVYVADTGNNAVKEMPAGCASSSCVTTLGGGFNEPQGVAVDGSGNVYVADTGNNVVKEIPAGCASSNCVTTLGGDINDPLAVAVDGIGNIYVSESGNPAVTEIPVGCESSNCSVTTLGNGLNSPQGLAVDGNGNVYVADTGNKLVEELDVADPPSLAFAATAVGSISSDSPQTVTLQNDGNADLNFTSSTPSGFSLDTSGCPQIDSTGSGPGTVAAGASCTLSVSFTPQSGGQDNRSLILTDNNLNVPSATQSIALTGMGVQITIAPGSLPPGMFGNSYHGLVLSASGGTSPYSFSISNGTPPGVTLSPSGVFSGIPTQTGSFTFTVTATDSLNFSGTHDYTLTIAPGVPSAPTIGTATRGDGQATVTFTPPASDGGDAIKSYTVTSSPGNITASGSVSPITVSGLTDGIAYSFTVTATNNAGTSVASASSSSVTPAAPVPATGMLTTPTLAANLVTLHLTSSVTGTGYFTILPGSGAACGSATQTAAGQDSKGAAVVHGSLSLAAGGAGNYTVRNLKGGIAYTACYTPDGSVSPTPYSFTTVAGVDLTSNLWATVGTAGFSTGATTYESLTFSPEGAPYVAYADAGSNKATVMQYNGMSWVTVGSADFSASEADYLSLAFSPHGTPYVSYADYGNSGKAAVMKYDGTKWEQVGPAGFSAGIVNFTSLAFSPDGTPYVAYSDQGNGSKATVMRYSTASSSWEAVGSTVSTGGAAYTSLAFSPDGSPYLAFEDIANGNKATVMQYNGSSWTAVGPVGLSTSQVFYTSLAFSPDGTPYLAYQDAANANKATVMQYKGSSWTAVGPAVLTDGAAYTSLAFSPDGKPFVAFENRGNNNSASVMQYNGTSWESVGLPNLSNGSVQYTSLAFSPAGTPYLAYQDNGNGNKATVMNFAPAPTAATGTATTVTSSGVTLNGTVNDNGLNTSIAFEYGTTISYGKTTPANPPSINAGTGSSAVSADLTTLLPATTYHFRVMATAGSVVVDGDDATFTTKAIPAITTPPTASSITYGQILVDSALTGGNASFNSTGIPGTFTWNESSSKPMAGLQSYTVVFTPNDGNMYETATVMVSLNVTPANLTITANDATRIYGAANPSFSGTVTGAVNGDTLTESFTTTATQSSSVGQYKIVPSASGTALNNYSVSPTSGTLIVSKATATVTFGNLTIGYTGLPISATATTDPSGLNVTFTYNGFPTAPTAAGAYTVVATVDDPNYTGIATGTLTIGSATAPTITWTTPASITYGTALSTAQLNATASVKGIFSYNPPSGTVLSAGTHTLTAIFTPTDSQSPDTPSQLAFMPKPTDYNSPPSASVTLKVLQSGTTTVLSTSSDSISAGQNVTFTAQVESSTTGMPTGNVNFYDGATLLGTSPLNNGAASFSTTTLAAGASHMISASYAGDTNFSSSTAPSTVILTVTSMPPQDFIFTVSATQTQTVIAGGSAGYTFKISPSDGAYPGSVNFTAMGLPPGATATFSPATIAADGGAQAVTLTVQTPASTAATSNPFNRTASLAICVLLLPIAGFRRIRCRTMMAVVGLVGLASLTGCGTSNGFNGQASKSYTITVTATSGTISHTLPVILSEQ